MSGSTPIARGTVLVDPRKAVEKLRAHQLAQPGLYVLEVIRAATLMGAREVTLENDSDDLSLAWEGAAPSTEDLKGILDHLFDANDRALRLLAVAVNAALGLDPAFVDLYTTAPGSPAGQAARVRYTARGAPLGECEVATVERPKSLPPKGFMLHVRERFGAAVMAEWLRREPSETALLRARLLAPRVSVAREGEAVRAPALETVASATLEPGAGITGALHLLADTRQPAALLLCELGVLLERRDLQSTTLSTTRRARFPDAALPLHLAVDADALDTNISRSQVDLDRGLGAALRRRWPGAVAALVADALARTTALAADDAARRAGEESLLALVLWAHGERWPEAALRETRDPPPEVLDLGALHDATLAPVFDAPLIPTPFGARVTLRALAGSRGQWASYTDDAPLPQELSRWLRDAVWSPSARPVLRALLSCVAMRNGARAHAEAMGAAKRLRALMAHPAAPVRVPRAGDALLRVAAETSELTGEIAVFARGREAPVMSATVFLEGRAFCEVSIGNCALSVRAAVQSPRLTPRPSFDGVIDDTGLYAVSRALREQLVRGIADAVASDGLRERPPEVRAALVRAAWIEARNAIEDAAVVRPSLRLLAASHPSLYDAPAWLTSEGALASTRAVVTSTEAPPRVLMTGAASTGSRPDGRRVLVLDAQERRCLSALLDESVRWLDAERFLPARRSASPGVVATASLQDAGFAWKTLPGERARLSVSASPTGKSTLVLLHSGWVVSTRTRSERLGPSVVALEDDLLIPIDDGGVSLSADATALLARAEHALAWALCDALTGDARERDALGWTDTPDRVEAARRFLLSALGRLARATGDDDALRARIESVPLVPRWTASGELRPARVDALRDELNRRGEETIGFLVEPPRGIEGEDFSPLVLPNRELQQLVAGALGVKPVSAEAALRAKHATRARRLAWERLRARSPERVDAPIDGRSPRALPPEDGVSVSWALAREPSAAQVRVLLNDALALINPDGPPESPLVIRVALTDDALFGDAYEKLTREGLARVAAQVLRAAVDAADLAVQRAEQGDDDDPGARRALYAWLTGPGRKLKDHPTLPHARLRKAPLWTLTTGARASINDALEEGGAVRVVTGWSAPWLPPAKGEAPDAPTLSLPTQADLDVVRALVRKIRDLTTHAREVQRRRAFARSDALSVRLPGTPPAPWASARIEADPRARGRGEVRLAQRGAGAEVSVFDGATVIARVRLDTPVAVDVAFASADLDPARVADSVRALGVAELATWAAHGMLRALVESRAQIPAWTDRAMRWHLCTALARTDRERHLQAFVDTAGAPMSLRDMESQAERFALAAYVVDAPDEPVTPREPERRVVVLTREEADAIAEGIALTDHSDAIAEDLAALRWSRTEPARIIAVPSPPAFRHRARLEAQRDGVEGEVLLLAADAPEDSVVHWFHRRRPLGHSAVSMPWPSRVAVDAPQLTPRRDHSAPIDDPARQAALDTARRAVSRALHEALAPPPGRSLVSIEVHTARSPVMSGGVTQAVGVVWLTDDANPGALTIEVAGGCHVVPATLPREKSRRAEVNAPIGGKLWLRKGAGNRRESWEPLARRVIAWSWRRLLDAWIERARVDLADDVTLAHLLHAGLADQLSSAASELARRAKLPGGELTVARAATLAGQGRALTAISPGDTRSKDTVLRSGARWFTLLEDAGAIAPRRVEAPAPQPVPSVEAPTAPAPSRVAPAAAATQRAPSTRSEILAQRTLDRLRALGVSPSALREIVVEPCDADIGYVRKTRRVHLRADAPWVRAALKEPERSSEAIALAVLGEVNRALDEVTDAHEETALRAMLKDLAG